MTWNNLIMVIGTVLMCFSKKAASYEMLIAGRFIIGIACGKKGFLFFIRFRASTDPYFSYFSLLFCQNLYFSLLYSYFFGSWQKNKYTCCNIVPSASIKSIWGDGRFLILETGCHLHAKICVRCHPVRRCEPAVHL